MTEAGPASSRAAPPVPVTVDDDWFARPVPANVVLGPGTWLYSAYAFLHYRSRRKVAVRIGHDCGIYRETFFDLGPDGEVEVGDYCTLAGPIISTNGRVTIGDYVLISREVFIADRPFAAPPCDDRMAEAPSEEITIGDNAWIGSRAILLPGAQVGEGAIIGAAAVVDFEVPPFAIVAGNPARIVGFARPQQGDANGQAGWSAT
jgi:acetyltransferase-like isoleucine patch superfamily enzyme